MYRNLEAIDILTYGLAIFLAVLLVLLPVACVQAIEEQKQLEQELLADDCKPTSETKTGNRIYCGKACWRDEKRLEFSCKSGVKVIIK